MGACDRNPTSPTAGLRIKTIRKYETVGCDCIPITTNIKEVCGKLLQDMPFKLGWTISF